MIRKFITVAIILGISLILISWGGVGHSIISANASLSFNSEMSQFNSWVSYLTDHASDADDRKSVDPTESKKHYIDIDNYSEFNSTGTIPQSIIDAINAHGASFVDNNGILPWATIAAFDSLKSCLKRNDIDNAKQYAADLGHYVADGHMPLHITDNYDGQNTNNKGIHSRYESTMIGANSSQINYTGSSINVIPDVNQYIFDYIYENNKYVDSILDADNYAVDLAGGTRNSTTYYSTTYKQALWNKTKGFTIKLFKNGSHALAELIYTAWMQSKLSTDVTTTQNITFTENLEQNVPNPFTNHTKITFNLNENADVTIQVKDILGKNNATLFKGFKTAGSYTIDWYPNNQHEGIYFLVLDTKKIHQVKKMILAK